MNYVKAILAAIVSLGLFIGINCFTTNLVFYKIRSMFWQLFVGCGGLLLSLVAAIGSTYLIF